MLQLKLPIPRFNTTPEIILGNESLSSLRVLDATRVLVITSKKTNQFHHEKIYKSINTLSKKIIEYSGGEPENETILPLVMAMREFEPDWIISIGGGSVIDSTKLAWLLYEQPEINLFEIRPFSIRPLRGLCKMIAVPTTAGTGSEVSSAAVLTDLNGGKKAIVSHEFLPDIAVLDPTLTTTVPENTLISAGMDALSHCLEAYVSKFENPLADIQAEKSASLILNNLAVTIDNPNNLNVRLNMMIASLMAGWVQNLKVPGIGHSIAHQLGRYSINHGIACGALLTHAIEYNIRIKEVEEKYNHLSKTLNLDNIYTLLSKINEIKNKIGFPKNNIIFDSDKRLLIKQDMLRLKAGAIDDICSRANPVEVDDKVVSSVIDKIIND